MPLPKLPPIPKFKSIVTDFSAFVRRVRALSPREFVRKVFLLCSLCALCFGLYGIGNRLFHYIDEDKQFANVKALSGSFNPEVQFGTTDTRTQTGIPDEADEFNIVLDNEELISHKKALPYLILPGDPESLNSSGQLKNYEKLWAQNPNMVGWILMPGFRKAIDYPIMQTIDNEYYLNRDFYQNISYAGSIFMDYRNSSDQPERNMIIYGHAMNDMSMFGNLKKYPSSSSDYTKFVTIYIDLKNIRLEYEVFSTYTEDASYPCLQTDFADDSEYLAFLQKIQNHSVYNYQCSLTPEDKILTLSTCNNTLFKDGRSILHARLTRQIVFNGITGGPYETSTADTKEVTSAVSANVYLNTLKLFYTASVTGSSIELLDIIVPLSDSIAEKSNESTNQIHLHPMDESSANHKGGIVYSWNELPFYPIFNTAFKYFEVKIPGSGKIALCIEPADLKAQLQFSLNEHPLDPSNSVVLEDGPNVLSIKVTSRDGLFIRKYSIRFVIDDKETGTHESEGS